MFIRRSHGLPAAPRNKSHSSEPDIRTVEKALREVGLSRKEAKALLAQGYKAIDPLRDAEQKSNMAQPGNLRDAGETGSQDIIDNLMKKINSFLKE